MKRLYYFLPLFALILLLSGCSDESKAKIDLSSYPESVQNGTISAIFYDEIKDYEEINNMHITKTSSFQDILDPQIAERLQRSVDEHRTYLEDLKFSPSTKEDGEILKHIEKINHEWLFINTGYDDILSTSEKNPILVVTSTDLMSQSLARLKEERIDLRLYLKKLDIDDLLSN